MIDIQLIENLPPDPGMAAAEFCKRILDINRKNAFQDPVELIELIAFFEVMCSDTGVKVTPYPWGYTLSKETTENILSYFNETFIQLKRSTAIKQAKDILGQKFFNSTDKIKTSQHIKQLRELIHSSSFPDEQKELLLSKLAELEIAFNSPNPVYDIIFMRLYRFTRWLDATSKAARPFLEPITELLKIANKLWPEQGQLPPGFFGLPPGSDIGLPLGTDS